MAMIKGKHRTHILICRLGGSSEGRKQGCEAEDKKTPWLAHKVAK
jgi:hypothetical protein